MSYKHFEIIWKFGFLVKIDDVTLPCLGSNIFKLPGIPIFGLIRPKTITKPSLKYCFNINSKLFWGFLRIWLSRTILFHVEFGKNRRGLSSKNQAFLNSIAGWMSGLKLQFTPLAREVAWVRTQQSTRFGISSLFYLFFSFSEFWKSTLFWKCPHALKLHSDPTLFIS